MHAWGPMQFSTCLVTSCLLASLATAAHADTCDALDNADTFVKSKFAVILGNAHGNPGEIVDVALGYNGAGYTPSGILLPNPTTFAKVAGVDWFVTDNDTGTHELFNPSQQVYQWTSLPSNAPGAHHTLQFHPVWDGPTGVDRFLVSRVTLTTGQSCIKTFTLAPVRIQQPLFAIPQLVMGFREINFGTGLPAADRGVLLWSNQGFTTPAQAMTAIQNVLNVATSLQTFADFNAYITPLQSAINSAAMGKMLVEPSNQGGNGNAIADLGGWFPLVAGIGPAFVNCEDIFRSMVVIGKANKTLELFNEKNFGTAQGAMTVRIGNGGVAILPDLTTNSTAGSAPMINGGAATITALPNGTYWILSSVTWPPGNHFVSSIGGEISSMRWQ